jgi:hypothetical protein
VPALHRPRADPSVTGERRKGHLVLNVKSKNPTARHRPRLLASLALAGGKACSWR